MINFYEFYILLEGQAEDFVKQNPELQSAYDQGVKNINHLRWLNKNKDQEPLQDRFCFIKRCITSKKSMVWKIINQTSNRNSKKNMLSKAQNRDPSLVDRTVLSYFDVSDQVLQYLSDEEKEKISQQAMNAVKQNSISSGFSQQIANQILTIKSQNIMRAIQNSNPKKVVM